MPLALGDRTPTERHLLLSMGSASRKLRAAISHFSGDEMSQVVRSLSRLRLFATL